LDGSLAGVTYSLHRCTQGNTRLLSVECGEKGGYGEIAATNSFPACSTALTAATGSPRRRWRRRPGGWFGRVGIRSKAHMFWWLYRSPHRVDNASTPWPTVLWLQGGPGASGVGIGNFEEIGPLDTDLKPRKSTWLQKADLLFVDNPVGTGYSFVEDAHALVKTDEEAGKDLTTLLKELFNGNKQLQGSPLYIIAESYGGKFAVTLGLSAARAIQAGELRLKLGGVALGDSWISPEDFVYSWGPLLRDVSRLDSNGLGRANSIAAKIRKQIEGGQYRDATDSWEELETVIGRASNSVDFYNFLLDSAMDPLSTASAAELPRGMAVRRYTRYLSSKASSSPGGGGGLGGLMNGPINQKLKIIPNNVSWGGQAGLVFDAFSPIGVAFADLWYATTMTLDS
ncbi:hypothetical protein Taro_054388, partial [Colocasia esculenta]|nr:hypothetical protein [Colocasia esculenta]